MSRKKILSAVLALIMASSSLSILSSCNKEEAPIKEKRTNVYSGEAMNLPSGISYISRIGYANGNVYAWYNKDYTITYNELGEEVERREGYYYQDYVYDDGIMVEEVVVEPVPYEEAPAEEVVEEGSADEVVEEETAETVVGEPELPETEITAQIEVDVNVVLPSAAENIVTLTAAAPVVNTSSDVATDDEGDKLPDGWWYSYESVQFLAILPLDGGEIKEVEMNFNEEYGYMNNVSFNADGSITAMTNKWQYNEETGSGSTAYRMLTIDAETGTISSEVLLNDKLAEAGIDMEYSYINSFKVTADGTIYIATDTSVVIFDAQVNYVKTLTLDNGWINGITEVGNKVYVAYYSDGNGNVCKLIENGELVDIQGENLKNVFENYWNIIGSSSDKIYYRMNSGVFVYDFVTDTSVEVLNFINSDIDMNNAGSMIALEDGRMIITETDWESEPTVTTLSILSKIPDEQLEEEIIVRIGSTSTNYNLTRAILRYNKQNTGIRIAVVSYDQYNNQENDWNGAVTQLNNDIITGKVPDILYVNSQLPVESYFQKGIFADLNTYIDDPEVGLNRADLMQNVLDANTVDGKLYSLITAFRLETLVAKSEFVGTEPGWTFTEMMNCIKNMPEGMTAFYDRTRENVKNTFFTYSMNSFVNWETGETKFDSPEFVDLMNYLMTCPEKSQWDLYWESMGGEYVYDQQVEQEMQEKSELRFYHNYGLFNEAYVNSYTAVLGQQGEFATDEITFIGYPTDNENSNGAVIIPYMEFAISATSRVKDEAWDILKFFMNDEEINSSRNRFYLSNAINQKYYEAAEENYNYYEESYDWYQESGYSEEYVNYLKQRNRKYDQAAVDQVLEIVKGAGEIQRTNTELLEIINEELSVFFAGSRSAEETAKIIASRARIYITENS